MYVDAPKQLVIDFPRDKEKKRFQAQWYTEFTWLDYELSTNSALCFI